MKLKSHSGLKKRVKFTAQQKIRMKKSCMNHLLVNKSKKQKRKFRNQAYLVTEHFDDHIRKLLPYA